MPPPQTEVSMIKLASEDHSNATLTCRTAMIVAVLYTISHIVLIVKLQLLGNIVLLHSEGRLPVGTFITVRIVYPRIYHLVFEQKLYHTKPEDLENDKMYHIDTYCKRKLLIV